MTDIEKIISKIDNANEIDLVQEGFFDECFSALREMNQKITKLEYEVKQLTTFNGFFATPPEESK